MLAMVVRPSFTIFSIEAKLESISTMCAHCFAASAPFAMAIPQSASLSARTSLMPSPTIPTTCPAFWKAWTSACFFSGVTRPNTLYFGAILQSSSISSGSVPASIYASAPGIPASLAMYETVTGSSPEMTLTATPCFAKKANVSSASSFTQSESTIRESGVNSSISFASLYNFWHEPSSSTRSPSFE